MNIVMITENDPAGMGIAFKNAINRHTDHHCRLVTTTTRYNFAFEKDIHVPDLADGEFELIVALLWKADIIHFHILADENLPLGPIRVSDYLRGKAIVHHHHGHPDFRTFADKYKEKYRKLRRKALVSTPDLLRLMPEAAWQPNLIPIHNAAYLPRDSACNGRVRVCQSPTRKDLKNTDEFRSVLRSIARRHDNVEEVIIENTPHWECLNRKQSCDIHFDHMQGYFGVSSLEGLSQGKPVIAGLDDWNLLHIKEFAQREELPWVLARDAQELDRKLHMLITGGSRRGEIGSDGRRFMEECWSEQQVLEPLLKVYGEL